MLGWLRSLQSHRQSRSRVDGGHKTWQSVDAVISNNVVYDTMIGIGAFNSIGTTISNNEIVDPTWDGVQIKGGARSAKVYGNYIHTTGGATMQVAIYLGGSSCVKTAESTIQADMKRTIQSPSTTSSKHRRPEASNADSSLWVAMAVRFSTTMW